MKWKYLAVLLSGIFAFGSVVSGSIYAKKRNQEVVSTAVVADQKTEKTKEPAAVTNASSSDILKKVYLTDSHDFLQPDLTADQLTTARSGADQIIDQAEREEIEKLINIAGMKLAILNDVNALYASPVLKGDEIDSHAKLKDGKTAADVEDMKKKVEEESNGDAFYQKILAILGSHPEVEGTASPQASTEQDAAADHPENVANARQLVETIVKDGKMNPDFTMEQYEQARDAVKSLPEGPQKQELSKDIETIQNALKNMGIAYEE